MTNTNRRAWVVGILAALGVGAITAVQALVNSELAVRVSDAMLAGAWSFISAAVIVTLVVLLRPTSRRGLSRVVGKMRLGEMSWWLFAGSLFGFGFIAIQSWTVSAIGVAVFSVAMVAGQNVGGLIIDRLGLTGSGVQSLNTGRVIAAIVGIGAALVAAAPALGAATASIAMIVAVLFAGVFASTQVAISGRITLGAHDTWVGAFGAFLVGAFAFAFIEIVRIAMGAPGVGALFTVLADSPMLGIGGICGAVLMFLASMSVIRVGVLIFGLAAVIGQFVLAIVIDAINGKVGGYVYIVIALALTAVSLFIAARWSRSNSEL